MPTPTCSEEEFIRLVETLGTAGTARKLHMGERQVRARRSRIVKRTGVSIRPPRRAAETVNLVEHPQRACFNIKNGTVIVGSDAHYWPNYISTAHKGFVKLCKELQPKVIVLNGDMLDGATISRFPPQNWEHRPALSQEVETVRERLDEIERAAPNAKKVWTLGNHDQRFESRLAQVAPEFKEIDGIHLKDHFPFWRPAWSCWINDEVVIKHRFKGGMHATHNNALWSGKTMVTGHLHSQKVTPLTDYNGIRWGVDTGTMADIYGPQFNDYTEDNPKNWRSGFGVLDFKDGQLLQPSLALVVGEGKIDFCREVIKV